MIELNSNTLSVGAKRVKTKLAGLNRRQRFRPCRESWAFARELEELLNEIRTGAADPLEGVRLACAFYDSDAAVFEHCDDSNGYLGDVFSYTAKELFREFAQQCEDKQAVADLVLTVNERSGYGVREHLIECAGECLPKEAVRSMLEAILNRSEKEKEEFERHHALRLVESLALQIKDAPLFAEVRQKIWGKVNSAAMVDIAEVYFESGDSVTAMEWLDKIAPDETFYTHERDQLLARIYQQTGDTENLTELLRRNLRKHHTTGTLDELISVIGEEHRSKILAEEVAFISSEEKLSYTNLEFLIETGRMAEAESYLLKRTEQLNGNFYETLIPLADAFQSAEKFMPASLIIRALLCSILERAYSKAYPYAVRYLRTLDLMEKQVAGWKGQTSHADFKTTLKERHGRKQSFWSRYTDKA